jgi:PAS domain-containing protein
MEELLARTDVEHDLSRVVDALPGLVWTALPDGDIDFLNQRWSEYTGLSAEAGQGRGWQSAVHPDDLPARALAIRSGWWQARRDGSPPPALGR